MVDLLILIVLGGLIVWAMMTPKLMVRGLGIAAAFGAVYFASLGVNAYWQKHLRHLAQVNVSTGNTKCTRDYPLWVEVSNFHQDKPLSRVIFVLTSRETYVSTPITQTAELQDVHVGPSSYVASCWSMEFLHTEDRDKVRRFGVEGLVWEAEVVDVLFND